MKQQVLGFQMRCDTKLWSATEAIHIGQSHVEEGKNCQDATALACWDDNWLCGVICDGCGGVTEDLRPYGLIGRTEVGAALLSQYIVAKVRHYSGIIPHESILSLVFADAVEHIYNSCNHLKTVQEKVFAIQQFWLCTVLGFVICDRFGFIFWCGDGLIQIDDDLYPLEQNNTPTYLGYKAIPDPTIFGVKEHLIAQKFTLQWIDVRTIKRLMIASDGFLKVNKERVIRRLQANYPSEIIGGEIPSLVNQQWGKKGLFGLKKWMNTRFDRGYFEDDCAIVVVEKQT